MNKPKYLTMPRSSNFRLLTSALFLSTFGCCTYVQADSLYAYEGSNGEVLFTDQVQKSNGLRKVATHRLIDSSITNISYTQPTTYPSSTATYIRLSTAYADLIDQAARQFQLESSLIRAVIQTESGFNFRARSPVGAQGLMQLMPATARRFSVSNAYDPAQNIFAGARYLRWLLDRYQGNIAHALAGYNAGEGNVDKYNGIPPFAETQAYVKKVINLYQSQTLPSIPSSIPSYPQSTTITYRTDELMASEPAPARIVKLSSNSFGDEFSISR